MGDGLDLFLILGGDYLAEVPRVLIFYYYMPCKGHRFSQTLLLDPYSTLAKILDTQVNSCKECHI